MPPVVSTEDKSNDSGGYLTHIFSRQALVPAAQSALKYLYGKGYYLSHTAMSQDPNFANVYQGLSKNLYDPNHPIGKMFSKMLLPKEARGTHLSPAMQTELKTTGAGYLKISHNGGQILNIGWLTLDIISMGQCFMNGGCSAEEFIAIGADIGRVSLNIYSIATYVKGLTAFAEKTFDQAVQYLSRTQRITWKIGGFQLVAGTVRFAIATTNYVETGEADGSEFTYAAIDGISGAAQMAKTKYLLNVASHAKDSNVAADMLAFKGIQYSARMTRFLQVTGAAGAVVGVGANGMVLYDSMTDPYMDENRRTKNIISSSMGIAGGAMLIASACIVAPAAAPVGIALAIGGAIIIGVQTVYDIFWD